MHTTGKFFAILKKINICNFLIFCVQCTQCTRKKWRADNHFRYRLFRLNVKTSKTCFYRTFWSYLANEKEQKNAKMCSKSKKNCLTEKKVSKRTHVLISECSNQFSDSKLQKTISTSISGLIAPPPLHNCTPLFFL